MKDKINQFIAEDYERAMNILSPYRPLQGNLADAAYSAINQIGWDRSQVWSMVKNSKRAHEGNDMLVIRPFMRTTNKFDDVSISCPYTLHDPERGDQYYTHFSDPFVFDVDYRPLIVIPAVSECGHRWLLVLENNKGLTCPYTICDEGYLNQNTVEPFEDQ